MKLKLLTNNFHKNGLLNFYFPLKKIGKIHMIFDIENSLRKSNFSTFLTMMHSSAKQSMKLFIGEDGLFCKTF